MIKIGFSDCARKVRKAYFEIPHVYIGRYGYHQRENTGSRLFTEVKPCWTGLISGWVTCAVLLGKSGWRSGYQ